MSEYQKVNEEIQLNDFSALLGEKTPSKSRQSLLERPSLPVGFMLSTEKGGKGGLTQGDQNQIS